MKHRNAGIVRIRRNAALAMALLIAVVFLDLRPGHAAPPKKLRDVDVKDIADLSEMTPEAVRAIVITKAVKEMSEKVIEIVEVVFTARLGTEVEFDPEKKRFYLAGQFETHRAAMDVVLNIAEPNAVSFAGVLAHSHSFCEKSGDGGFRVVLLESAGRIFPTDKQRRAIARAIEEDDVESTELNGVKRESSGEERAAVKTPGPEKARQKSRGKPKLLDLPDDVDFSAGAAPSGATAPVQDQDSTPEGQTSLRTLKSEAEGLYRELQKNRDTCLPLVRDHDTLVGRAAVINGVIAIKWRQLATLSQQEANIVQRLQNPPAGQRPALQKQLGIVQQQKAARAKEIGDCQVALSEVNTSIGNVRQQIVPLVAALKTSRTDMNVCRGKWLQLRQPLEKYSRGDLDSLQTILNDWLQVDPEWTEALGCAALCSVEREEIPKAADYLAKCEKAAGQLQMSKRQRAWLAGVTAVVLGRQPEQSTKADKAATYALQNAHDTKDWDVFFFVGRYYHLSGTKKAQAEVKAKANYEKSLRIRPGCHAVLFQLARLQTVATNERVRDIAGAIRVLETLWKDTGEKSWRIAHALADACVAAGRNDDAMHHIEKAIELAPKERHQPLKALLARLQSAPSVRHR